MAYCMAMVLMFFKVSRTYCIGSLNLSSSSFIGLCVSAMAAAVITMSGSIFHPRATMFSIVGLHLLALASSVSGENISSQYVMNSMNYMVSVWSIFVGVSF